MSVHGYLKYEYGSRNWLSPSYKMEIVSLLSQIFFMFGLEFYLLYQHERSDESGSQESRLRSFIKESENSENY